MRPTSTSVRRFSFSARRRFCVGSSPLRRRASRSPCARRFACRRKTLRRNSAMREALRRSAKPVPTGCAAGRRGGRPGVPGFRHLRRSLLVASACRRFGYGFRLLAASAAMNRMSGSVPCLGRNFSALSENRGGMSFVDLSGLSSRVVPSLRPGFGRVSVRDRPCGCRAMNIRSGCSDFRPFSVRRSVWPPFPFFDAPDRSSLPCGAACRFCRSFAVSLSEASPEGVHTLCVRPVRLRSRRPGPGGLRTERAERSDCGFSVSDRPVRQKNGRRTFRSVSRREYAVFAV